MRTTLTVNDNIMQKLKEKAHKTGMPLKQVVNTALEIGLRNFNSQQSKKYKLKTFSLGAPLIADIDKALKIATKMEDDEIIRKLEVMK